MMPTSTRQKINVSSSNGGGVAAETKDGEELELGGRKATSAPTSKPRVTFLEFLSSVAFLVEAAGAPQAAAGGGGGVSVSPQRVSTDVLSSGLTSTQPLDSGGSMATVKASSAHNALDEAMVAVRESAILSESIACLEAACVLVEAALAAAAEAGPQAESSSEAGAYAARGTRTLVFIIHPRVTVAFAAPLTLTVDGPTARAALERVQSVEDGAGNALLSALGFLAPDYHTMAPMPPSSRKTALLSARDALEAELEVRGMGAAIFCIDGHQYLWLQVLEGAPVVSRVLRVAAGLGPLASPVPGYGASGTKLTQLESDRINRVLTALATVSRYAGNAISAPSQPRFWRINAGVLLVRPCVACGGALALSFMPCRKPRVC
jgi:hypothetical protein